MEAGIREQPNIQGDSKSRYEGSKNGIHLNRWNLAFSGPHAHLEKMFNEFYRPKSLDYVRFILVSATLLYAAFGITDALLVASHRYWSGTVHIVLICFALLSTAIFSFHPLFTRVAQPIFLVLIVLCGVSATTMILNTPPPVSYFYFNGLIIIIFLGYAITRLPFLWAVSAGWTLGILYLAAIALTDTSPKSLIYDGFYLIAANLLGMLACYLMEQRARRHFWLIHILAEEEQKVMRANLELEAKVEERTADLRMANQKLETTIEEHKLMAEELAQSEKKYRELVETTPDFIFTVDRRGCFTFINPQFERVIGYTLGDLAGKPFTQILPEEFKKFTVDRFLEGIRGKQTGPYVAELISRNGKRIPVEFLVTTLSDAEGKPSGRLGIGRDITERRMAEELLRESEERFRQFFTHTPDYSYMINHRGRIIDINEPALKTLGYQKNELLGQPFSAIYAPESMDKMNDLFSQWLKTGHIANEVMVIQTKSGEMRKVLLNMGSVRDKDGNVLYATTIQTDITDRERLEAQLIRAQRMESIGTLAGGIAHDFNNILSAIMGYTEMAMAKLPRSRPEHLYLTRVFRASERARDLVKQILDFSRQSKQEVWPLRLTTVVKEALKLLRASIPATIRIVQQMETEHDLIMADPTQIHQVIMNLCTNAAHAMRERGGVLTVRLTSRAIYPGSDKPAPDLTIGPYAVLSVSDTGHGIDEAIMDRIFDPFFTTKEPGEGTGMGLSVVHGIVKSHNGTATVESRIGQGTTFHVYLPLLEEKVVAPTADIAARAVGGDERILFVDDEPELAHLSNEMLTDLGYRVTSLTSPLKALELFRDDPRQFDLVITDQTMPDMTGTELARALLAIRPDIPIVLSTGFAEATSLEEIEKIGIRDTIIKPIVQRYLSAIIRRALEPAPGEEH